MNKEQMSSWFINKLNSCYPVKHEDIPDSIFWMNDDKIIRKIKLCKLNNQKINNIKVKGKCLFEQNIKYRLFICDYNEIWKVLENNYSSYYNNIQYFVSDIINNENNVYTVMSQSLTSILFVDKSKLKYDAYQQNLTGKYCFKNNNFKLYEYKSNKKLTN